MKKKELLEKLLELLDDDQPEEQTQADWIEQFYIPTGMRRLTELDLTELREQGNPWRKP